MKIGFKDNSFAFELVRNLGFMYYGGSDLGEMMATVETIEEGNFESWFRGWDARARKLKMRADAARAAGHLTTARELYLRTSTCFRMAEFRGGLGCLNSGMRLDKWSSAGFRLPRSAATG